MPPTLYLIDGHAVAYRAYFALTAGGISRERWQTKSGEPTAGTYGFASIFMKILEQYQPEYLAVAFDTGKTFRDDIYPEYKATREKMPDDLRPQIERIRDLVDAFNIPRLEVKGFEADDILGTIAHQAVDAGFGVKIITGDRDLLQLVNDRIVVNLPGSKLADAKDYLKEDVRALWGINPDQVVDYKALVGDSSDNIKGVPGIGEKTALSLLKQFPSLDEIYQHLDELPERVKAKLVDGRDSAYISQKLARIVINAPISLNFEDARMHVFDPIKVETILNQLEFRSLLSRFYEVARTYGHPIDDNRQLPLFATTAGGQSTSAPSSSIKVTILDSIPLLSTFCNEIEQAPLISFDTETTSTDPMRAELVGISLSIREGEGYYIPIGHQVDSNRNIIVTDVLKYLEKVMTNPKIIKVGHNIKYDYLVLWRHGLVVSPLSFDTMIAGFLINPASRNLGLKSMARDLLDIEMTQIETLIGSGKNQIDMAHVSVESAAAYAAADAEVTLRLVPILSQELKRLQATQLFETMEMPLVPVLAEMERNGIAIDVTFFTRMSEELTQRLQTIEGNIYEMAGVRFNINSTQQLSNILFEKMQLIPPDRGRKTSSGHYSTSANVLEYLRGDHPIIDLVLEYRELAKLKSTYVDALPSQMNPQTHRIHTSFNQTGTVTGRLASSEPNLQNIPTRTELGHKVRQGFIASPGNVLLSVDYSQIELRIVAAMSEDENMCAAFRANQDIHATTASAIYNIPLGQVSKDQRRHAKAINFGLIYGMSAFGLSRSTDLTLAESEEFVKSYFKQFPGVKSFLDGLRKSATEQGYVETLLGRKRYFPGLKTQTNPNLRNREEREAINAPIQGTAADILKLAMIKIPQTLKQSSLAASILLQVHDELVLECPRHELLDTARIIRQVMENVYKLNIPITTDASWGLNWGELIPLDEKQL
ncbi:MAG: DNA polymerase I [Anaerolineaceae bacterium]|nr:DNA polymerase I [Anaerolineaceae bacterium]